MKENLDHIWIAKTEIVRQIDDEIETTRVVRNAFQELADLENMKLGKLYLQRQKLFHQAWNKLVNINSIGERKE